MSSMREDAYYRTLAMALARAEILEEAGEHAYQIGTNTLAYLAEQRVEGIYAALIATHDAWTDGCRR